MNKLWTILLLGPLLLADDPARIAVPAEAEQLAKTYFEERWKPSVAEHYGVADGEISHARLVVPFQEFTLRGDAATRFLMSDDLDPRPYAVIKRYTFPIVAGDAHLGSIIVQYNQDEKGEKFDDSAGEYFFFGLSARGNIVDEHAMELRAREAPGSTVAWVQIIDADVTPRFMVRLPDGSELSAPEGEQLIPLSEDGKRMKQEIRSGSEARRLRARMEN